MSNSLKVLADNRDALLLAEVAAWLHMFGKLHEEFLKGDHEMDIKIPSDVPTELRALLMDGTWTGNVWNKLPIKELRTKGLSINSLITRHRRGLVKGSEGFIQLMVDAHGRGSGIEKGILNRFAPGQETKVCLSTSLGHEATYIDLDAVRDSRQHLYDFLRLGLTTLKGKNVKLNEDEWVRFRQEFIQKMMQSFLITVAETRRPFNDVTLLDQTAISVAFFKAALAQNLLQGKWKEPYQEKVADQYRWRLLRVGLDGLSFWGNSTRIGDLLARKQLIKDTLDEVQRLLEVIHPFGAEVYRDEDGSIFIVPDIPDLLSYTDGVQFLEEKIQTIADEGFAGETQFTLLSSHGTRDALLFGELAVEMLPLPTPLFTWLKQQWQGGERDICPVCGLRPQGPSSKALSRKVCNICEERRSNRSEQWIKNPATTIWIDEVADRYGQLVLLVASFDMVDWLSGSAFNTILSFDPQSRQLHDKNPRPRDFDFNLQVLKDDIQDGLKPGQKFEDNLLGKLVLKDSRSDSEVVQDFYDLHVTHTDLGANSSVLKSELLALSLIQQPPSFARIRRTWETIRKFWEEIESSIKTTIGEVGTRIKLRGMFIPIARNRSRPIVSHTYELKIAGINLSITCSEEGDFLTVDNLQRVAILLGAPRESYQNYSTAANYVFERIQSEYKSNGVIEIEEPTGYGGSNQILGSLEITEISLEQQFNYLPAITILTEPRTFMAFVPAQDAWDIVQLIEKKYETEIGKVGNRLPLKLGAVFADRRTPLPAILDTGRRMLKQPTRDECWTVVQKVEVISARSSIPDEVLLTVERGGQRVLIKTKIVMGDGNTEDAWYPYWCVEEDKDGKRPLGRKRQFVGANGKEWVHVCNLKEGDVVHFIPPHFDFEFLDTAARRFEVSYDDNGKRRGSYHPARPYYLEQIDEFDRLWDILSNGLATSQVHTLIEIIENKRQEWLVGRDKLDTEIEQKEWLAKRAAFQHIVRDALANANWNHRPGEDDYKCLEQAALSGQLADVVELHMRILKESTKVDEMGGNQ